MNETKTPVRKILLVPDNPGWAFDNRAKKIISLPTNNLQFEIKYYKQVTKKDINEYDLIYPMSVGKAKGLHQKGIPANKMAAGLTSVRQFKRHMTSKGTFKNDFITFLKGLRGVNSLSDELFQHFTPYRKIIHTKVGVDENQFTPSKLPISNSSFTVGWVGRIDGPGHREFEGYDIVTSAIHGLDIKLDIRTFTENYVPLEKMTEFYQGLDCFICSSKSEGHPNPVFEAAACGVPIISTKVGSVPELIKSHDNGIIVKRDPQSIREAIQYLMNHPDKQKSMGQSIRKTILKEWTWKTCWKEWEDFFTSI
ncbi:glycosyltransferase [Bacillus sp. 1NLA3E]|uniref:glycosyltransferase n=1 Tax=Bacillus sp. 1NLA3E TaxID=666686 RepID=UPI000247E36C|nr:glycosyltransferase [Bacillus sp. 1NLA3E]